jgi:23S rRNA (guanosine2251-2'-O)-methyltransferase
MQGRKRHGKFTPGQGRERDRGGERPSDPGSWLFGTHAVAAALGNPRRQCRRLLLTKESEREFAGLTDRVAAPEVVEREQIERLLPRGAVHQGAALLADPLPGLDLEEAAEPKEESALVVVLDRVTDPHNVGAIVRSAAAFGALAVVLTDRHAPTTTGVLAKAASGAIEHVPIVRVPNLARALRQLGDLGYWRIGLDAGVPTTLAAAVGGQRRIALVLGAEGSGMRRLTGELCDVHARLPIGPAVESLNVSNAAAVALYECVRER